MENKIQVFGKGGNETVYPKTGYTSLTRQRYNGSKQFQTELMV